MQFADMLAAFRRYQIFLDMSKKKLKLTIESGVITFTAFCVGTSLAIRVYFSG